MGRQRGVYWRIIQIAPLIKNGRSDYVFNSNATAIAVTFRTVSLGKTPRATPFSGASGANATRSPAAADGGLCRFFVNRTAHAFAPRGPAEQLSP
jgi:hypothetical protein